MYEDDGIERWRRGERRRYPGERAAAVYSAPSSSVSSSMSASHSSKSERSLLSSSSSRSWKSRCRRTGEFCAAGHELVQIPFLDRQQYLRWKQMKGEQQERQLQQQRFRHPFDPPSQQEQCRHAARALRAPFPNRKFCRLSVCCQSFGNCRQ